eukprot:GDKH01021296.1.p2 GENE.GDKH01021296.1~~GDKH01021296.1.p2  ORF type:complete len:81 (-),score=22.45 GDKH01021296.1:431-673(-)
MGNDTAWKRPAWTAIARHGLSAQIGVDAWNLVQRFSQRGLTRLVLTSPRGIAGFLSDPKRKTNQRKALNAAFSTALKWET